MRDSPDRKTGRFRVFRFDGGCGMTVDPKTFPSVIELGNLISDQIGEYNERHLAKIAADIKNGVPHAEEAFHYVYSRMMGWN